MDKQPLESKLTRRQLLTRGTKVGLGLVAAGSVASLVGCGPVGGTQQAESKPSGGQAPSAPAVVKGQTMKVAIWAGAFANTIRESLVPDFEKDHGVKVAMEEGISADAIAKVRTARGNPTHTVIGVDDQFIAELEAEGLLSKLTTADVPNMADMFPEYIVEDGYGLGIAVSWNTLHYNTDKVKTAPTSYQAMWDDAYKGRVAIQSITAGTGLQFFMAAAALATGKPIVEAQYEAEKAFPLFVKLKPNIHSMVKSMNTALPLIAQGEIWLINSTSRLAGPYIVKGAPLKMAQVKEGPFMLLNSIALVAGAPLAEQGKDFINRMISPEMQVAMAKSAFTGSVNKKADVPSDLKGLVPAGQEDAAKMVKLDWAHVIKNRAAWIDRWNKEIGS